MRLFRQLSLFIITTLLFSSCAPGKAVDASVDTIAEPAEVTLPIPAVLQPATETSESGEPNECLNCHSDKDRLIETADAVEPISEGESKGVG